MTTIRVKKDKRYSTIYNPPFENSKLSWEARGLLAYLLTKPDDWTIMLGDLVKQGDARLFKVRRMLKELEAWGHVERKRVNAGGGKFRWETTINEKPNEKPTIYQLPNDGSTNDGSSIVGQPHDIVIPELPITELPNTNGKELAADAAPPDVVLMEIPSSLDNKPFLDKLDEWAKYRKGKKKPLSNVAWNKQIALLAQYPHDAIDILETSMRNDWTGLFPLKQNGRAPKPAQPTPSMPSEEELNRQRADVAAKVKERDAKRKAGIQDPDDF